MIAEKINGKLERVQSRARPERGRGAYHGLWSQTTTIVGREQLIEQRRLASICHAKQVNVAFVVPDLEETRDQSLDIEASLGTYQLDVPDLLAANSLGRTVVQQTLEKRLLE